LICSVRHFLVHKGASIQVSCFCSHFFIVCDAAVGFLLCDCCALIIPTHNNDILYHEMINNYINHCHRLMSIAISRVLRIVTTVWLTVDCGAARSALWPCWYSTLIPCDLQLQSCIGNRSIMRRHCDATCCKTHHFRTLLCMVAVVSCIGAAVLLCGGGRSHW
jgi:hypothetical protein